MGVPKFYRYIAERYPCLCEVLKDYQIPQFDNLYLDMNGIIHNCSHPRDVDMTFSITYEEIFKNTFHYIEILFSMIQPQKLFFMAIDGVAPRAKINQQRARRFRTAKEAEVKIARAKASGAVIKDKPFDSNCITPSTDFMNKLNIELRKFIEYKITTDKLWQKCKVFLSSSEVPGEGEHKIMDYIRYLKSQADYDVNTRHCLYGLDADLIMLGLCTHELNFTLLREEVKFVKKQTKILTPEETKFCLLHLSLLRDYLKHEFAPIKDKLSFPFDIECIIDDWVLMGFLVGNDFIPNLPNLHIANGALPVLYHTYMEVLPTLEGYMNESGTLRLDRFEVFMEKLSRIDLEQFTEHFYVLKNFEAKLSRDRNPEIEGQISPKDEDSSKSSSPSIEVENLPKSSINMEDTNTERQIKDTYDDDYESDSDTYNMEFILHKRDYYMNKLQYEDVNKDVLRSQAEEYVRAIQWNLNYYYNGCCSWSWYYPHHYAPYISDIKDFKHLKLDFELGEPFLPFQQLLAILPPYSMELLPKAFQTLVIEEQSPIIDYYPSDFKTDLNGKKNDWEGIVLIPFIDEKTLLNAMEPYYAKLTPDEQKRNNHGPMHLYSYTNENLGICNYSLNGFLTFENHAKVQLINHEDICVPKEKLVKGLHPRVKLDVYCPGFPTLNFIPHTASLQKAEIKVFEHPSRGENMILSIDKQYEPNIKKIAASLLNKTVFVQWPFLHEANAISVSNSKWRISLINPSLGYSPENIEEKELKGILATKFLSEKNDIAEAYKNRFGIEVGKTNILIHAQPLIGSKYVFTAKGKLSLEKQWREKPIVYAYQTVVHNISTYSLNSIVYKSIEEMFAPGNICFMLGHPNYGAMGKVIDPKVETNSGKIKVCLKVTSEPDLTSIKQAHSEGKTRYVYGSTAAQMLGISSHFLSRITGAIFIKQSNTHNRINVGLNLKFNQRNEEVPGYTKKENGQWLYSTRAIDLVRAYMKKYPTMLERLALNITNKVFNVDELFDTSSNELSNVVAWLKEQHFYQVESRECGSIVLDVDVVQQLDKKVEEFYKTNNQPEKAVIVQVKPHLLYKPDLYQREIPPDPKSQTRLLDRIVCSRGSFTVPLGSKGTIIRISKAEEIIHNIYDVLFDEPFLGGLTFNGCPENRGYKLSRSDFINISYGERIGRVNLRMSNASTETIISWRQHDNVNNQVHSDVKTVLSNKVSNQHQFAPEWVNKKNVDQSNHNTVTIPAVDASKQKRYEGQHATVEPCKSIPPTIQYKPSNELEQASKQLPSEFQKLWSELHKRHDSLKSSKTVTTTIEKSNEITKQSQDPSAFLREVLKISDEYKPKNSATKLDDTSGSKSEMQINKSSDAPPLVQKLFDYARQKRNEIHMKDENKSIWYCSQLLNYYQMLGVLGFPKYDYFLNKENNMIQAQIMLPNRKIYVGNPCFTHAAAAENVARQVYQELSLDKTEKSHSEILLKPESQQWVSTWQTNAWSRNLTSAMVQPCIPKVYSDSENAAVQYSKWNMKMQQDPGFSHVAPHHSNQIKVQKSQVAGEITPEIKNSTSFVPLQAQKKSRNVSTKQINKTETKNPVNTNTQSTKQSVKQQEKKDATFPEPPKTSNLNKTTEKEVHLQNNSQSSPKLQKSGRPKRSRVAAKFVSPPATNGGEQK